MSDLLKKYIKEIILEIQGNPRVSSQLVEKDPSSPKKDDEKDVEEMSTVATSLAPGGGFIAPFGWTNADMQGPSARSKGRKKSKRR
jgi:hypothetical protein